MNNYTFRVTKTFVVSVDAENETKAKEALLEDIADGGYSYSIDRAEPELELIHSWTEEPGFVIYLKDQGDPELWERSQELPDVYPDRDAAVQAVIKFSDRAAVAGFSYPVEDFKVIEKFIPSKEE